MIYGEFAVAAFLYDVDQAAVHLTDVIIHGLDVTNLVPNPHCTRIEDELVQQVFKLGSVVVGVNYYDGEVGRAGQSLTPFIRSNQL